MTDLEALEKLRLTLYRIGAEQAAQLVSEAWCEIHLQRETAKIRAEWDLIAVRKKRKLQAWWRKTHPPTGGFYRKVVDSVTGWESWVPGGDGEKQ